VNTPSDVSKCPFLQNGRNHGMPSHGVEVLRTGKDPGKMLQDLVAMITVVIVILLPPPISLLGTSLHQGDSLLCCFLEKEGLAGCRSSGQHVTPCSLDSTQHFPCRNWLLPRGVAGRSENKASQVCAL
jgi:hypothetical protein